MSFYCVICCSTNLSIGMIPVGLVFAKREIIILQGYIGSFTFAKIVKDRETLVLYCLILTDICTRHSIRDTDKIRCSAK